MSIEKIKTLSNLLDQFKTRRWGIEDGLEKGEKDLIDTNLVIDSLEYALENLKQGEQDVPIPEGGEMP